MEVERRLQLFKILVFAAFVLLFFVGIDGIISQNTGFDEVIMENNLSYKGNFNIFRIAVQIFQSLHWLFGQHVLLRTEPMAYLVSQIRGSHIIDWTLFLGW